MKQSQDQSNHTKPAPIKSKEEVAHNPDKKIDDDFPGFPDAPSEEKTIDPASATDRTTADINYKDGEKRNRSRYSHDIDESQSDGSGSAFDRTEQVNE